MDKLFTPFISEKLNLNNRVIMAPMTRSQSPQHIPTQAVADYYRERVEGGVSLIITEGACINHPAAHGYPDVPNMHGEDALAGWQRVVDEVHLAGGKIFPQLWHVGSSRQAEQCDNPDVKAVGPSAIAYPDSKAEELPLALSQTEIDGIINAYVEAAVNAKAIGFDGIEIHAAHGYLIDQFFWAETNKRTDKYGGETLAQRTRFATEIITAIRSAVGPDYPICFRFSQWKLGAYDVKMAETPEILNDFLQKLVQAGVDIFHASTRRFYEAEFPKSELSLAAWTKKLSNKPVIAVGSVGLDNDFIGSFHGENSSIAPDSMVKLEQDLTDQKYDLVAVGRMLIANPNWANLVKQGEEIIPFNKEMLAGL